MSNSSNSSAIASTLTYDVSGEGQPILCLHGHPGSRQCMRVITQSLGPKWMTIAPDLRGYGASKAKQPFEMQQHLHDVFALLEWLQLSEVIVLGWSLGGIIGTELTLQHPERVKGLILVASSARPLSDHPPLTWIDYAYTLVSSLVNRTCPGLKWNREWFGRRSLYRYLVQNHSEQVYKHLANDAWPAFFRTSQYANQALNQALKAGYNRLDDLHRIHCPTLVLAGECDRHITAPSSFKTHQHLPNSEWKCYPNTAHLFPWEIAEEVNRDIERWLSHHFA